MSGSFCRLPVYRSCSNNSDYTHGLFTVGFIHVICIWHGTISSSCNIQHFLLQQILLRGEQPLAFGTDTYDPFGEPDVYVATIAICLSLLSYAIFTRPEKEDNKVNRRLISVLAIVIIVLLMIFGTGYAKKTVFHSFGIKDIPKGKPAAAYAYMGITSEGEVACGPGSYS